MSSPLTTSACLVPTDLPEVPPPTPDTLTYGFTLPAEAVSSWVARAAVRVVLQAHGVEGMTDVAVQVVGELTACACCPGGGGAGDCGGWVTRAELSLLLGPGADFVGVDRVAGLDVSGGGLESENTGFGVAAD